VAARLRLPRPTVTKWRSRFVARRLEGSADEPRPGTARTINDEQAEQVLVATLETTPPTDATNWSTRSLARKLGMSQSAISRIWRAFGLKPHLIDTFKLSTDPQFIDKVRDVVGLYLNPPQAALVLCVDEQAQVQALDRTQPILPLLPGTPQQASHDYIRHGTTNLYAALDVASGKVNVKLTARHRAIEIKRFLTTVDRQVPAGLELHVIVDNSSTHKTPAIQRWLLGHPGVHLYFTPTYSWSLNLVERWFAKLTSKWLRHGTHRSVAQLQQSIRTWIEAWNQNPARLCGTRPPTRSSTPSPPTASESTTQDTSMPIIWNMRSALAPPASSHPSQRSLQTTHGKAETRTRCMTPRSSAVTSSNAATPLLHPAGHPRMCAVHVPARRDMPRVLHACQLPSSPSGLPDERAHVDDLALGECRCDLTAMAGARLRTRPGT